MTLRAIFAFFLRELLAVNAFCDRIIIRRDRGTNVPHSDYARNSIEAYTFDRSIFVPLRRRNKSRIAITVPQKRAIDLAYNLAKRK